LFQRINHPLVKRQTGTNNRKEKHERTTRKKKIQGKVERQALVGSVICKADWKAMDVGKAMHVGKAMDVRRRGVLG